MRKVVPSLILLFFITGLFSCDQGTFLKEISDRKTVFIKFVNKDGENLASGIIFKLDTVREGNITRLNISPEEYTLELLVNGQPETPALSFYSFPEFIFIFDFPGGEGGVLAEGKHYTYEYKFRCPKLFRDSTVHTLRVHLPWTKGYHPVHGIYFDDKLLTNVRSQAEATAVVE